MATIYGKSYSRREFESAVGRMDQVAGITMGELTDGRARGVRTAEIRTGGGLSATIALDRAMDIVRADFNGMAIGWRSVVGDVHPAYAEEPGLGWLRSFTAGPLTTCGLAACGAPCVDRDEPLGLHGRISSLPAENVAARCEWKGNEYVMTLTGEITEGFLFGACLKLTRTLTTTLGTASLTILDEVTNIGLRSAPHMMLYHCNFGFPMLAPGARLLAPSVTVQPNTPDAEDGKRDYASAAPPTRGYAEKVYEHALAARRGRTAVALVNELLGDGAGVYLRFRTDQLPVFNQWKMMGEREYVMGLEPATNGVTGRANERRNGRLATLRPGQSRTYELELGVLDGPKAIAAMTREIRAIRGRKPAIGTCG